MRVPKNLGDQVMLLSKRAASVGPTRDIVKATQTHMLLGLSCKASPPPTPTNPHRTTAARLHLENDKDDSWMPPYSASFTARKTKLENFCGLFRNYTQTKDMDGNELDAGLIRCSPCKSTASPAYNNPGKATGKSRSKRTHHNLLLHIAAQAHAHTNVRTSNLLAQLWPALRSCSSAMFASSCASIRLCVKQIPTAL